jgi:L-threonylcarbamoyladenylate synthase
MASISTDITIAKTHLQAGESVAIPTETVYGLAANALDAQAVAKVFAAKSRPTFDPLIVHIAYPSAVEKYARAFPGPARDLAMQFWPGPLTLLLPKHACIPDLVTAGLDTVGLRCPNHPLTLGLLRQLNFPLAAPSANPFGYISPTTAQHVQDQLGELIPFILDGGACTVGVESTIVGFAGGVVTVHRLGGLSVESIERVVGKVEVITNATSNPNAPGQLESHYAPRKKMVVGTIESLMRAHYGKRIGVLSFQTRFAADDCLVLSETGSLTEAAQNIFSMLRALDQRDIEIILAEFVPDKGLGRAINDRIKRAAAH